MSVGTIYSQHNYTNKKLLVHPKTIYVSTPQLRTKTDCTHKN